MAEAAVQAANYLLNLYDPAKDLQAGSYLTGLTEAQKRILETMIKELVSPTKDLPKGYDPTEDKKAYLINEVNTLLAEYISGADAGRNKLQVLRETHTTGHDSRPTGLFVCQDAGPVDVVKNPTFLLTPATVLDPASKTKKNAVNLIREHPTLPHSYVRSVDLQDTIPGEITMTEKEDVYTVQVPISFGTGTATGAGAGTASTLTGEFSKKTFKPINPKAPFGGNPEKNQAIAAFLEKSKDAPSRDECKQLILAKELGDTLQVLWIVYLIALAVAVGEKKVDVSTTVVTTNDTVVWLRCLVNKVPVIYTEYRGESYLWNPREADPAAIETMRRRFLETIRAEVITHNESVIELIRAARNSPRNPSTKVWINHLEWNTASYTHATQYLDLLISALTNINKDLDKYFSIIPTVDAAKELAERSHFMCPFKRKTDGFYYTINTVSFLLPSRFHFKAKSFAPTKFEGGIPTRDLFQQGGRQSGGARFDEDTMRARVLARDFQSLLHDAVENSQEANPHEIPAHIAERQPPEAETTEDTYDLSYWATNTVHLDAKNFFLFSYIRELHPQVFTYANLVKEVLPEDTQAIFGLVSSTMIEDFPTRYHYAQDNSFIADAWAGDPMAAYSAALQAVVLARVLIDSYPQITTPDCRYFLTLFNSHAASLAYYTGQLAIEVNQSGGGTIVEETLADKALDLYEIYYSYRIRALYQDRMLTQTDSDELLESLRMARGEEPSVAPSPVKRTKTPSTPQKRIEKEAKVLLAQGGKRYRSTRKHKKSKASRTKRKRSTKRIRLSQK